MSKNNSLDVLGLPIVDHCNLNCKGCYHFCTFGRTAHFVSVDMLKYDLKRFKELVDHIDWIKLYGGEPLLHLHLKECGLTIRQTYPYSEICLMTNGLLIRSLDDETINALKFANIKMDITSYPVLENELPAILKFLEEKKIRTTVNHVNEFGRRFNKKGDSNPEETYQKCEMKICHYLQEGEFVMCPLPIFIRRYNQLFGTHFNMSNDILDIHNPEIKFEDIYLFANRQHECCKYCGETEFFPWAVGEKNPQSSDWEIKA